MDALVTAPTGSLGEEAARLLEALGMWARGSLDGHGAEDLHDAGHERISSRVGGAFRTLNDSIADGSPACRVCPVCQLIAVVRHAKPETFTHLLDASAALTAALRSVVEQAEHGERERRSGVQRIDLDPVPDSDGPRQQASPA